MSLDLTSAYRELLASGAARSDRAQRDAVAALERLSAGLSGYHPGSLLRLIGHAKPAPRGVYLHGRVGGGKTMLMDLLFASTSFASKRRLHFDAFMAEAHAAIETARDRDLGDPMPEAARLLSEKGLLLCLDEFQVNDIADAMILSRLFRGLFKRGLVLVTTSNSAPDDLYRDGLNRQLFVPFIDLLKLHTDIIEVAAARDYRLDKLMGRQLYVTPLGAAADAVLHETWRMMTGNAQPMHKALDVAGRKLDIARAAGGTVWLSFAELCERPLGAADYRAIARAFHTAILEDIPALGPEKRNEARRFITLVDALYDAKVRLIASAEAEPEALYTSGDGSLAFTRTASRLIEMRSRDYLEAAHPTQNPALPEAAASD